MRCRSSPVHHRLLQSGTGSGCTAGSSVDGEAEGLGGVRVGASVDEAGFAEAAVDGCQRIDLVADPAQSDAGIVRVGACGVAVTRAGAARVVAARDEQPGQQGVGRQAERSAVLPEREEGVLHDPFGVLAAGGQGPCEAGQGGRVPIERVSQRRTFAVRESTPQCCVGAGAVIHGCPLSPQECRQRRDPDTAASAGVSRRGRTRVAGPRSTSP